MPDQELQTHHCSPDVTPAKIENAVAGLQTRSLRRGSTGEAVKTLQRRLRVLGFSAGRIDGDFGPATEAAVIAFQRAKQLLPDGIVGPRTVRAMDLAGEPATGSVAGQVTVALVSRLFPETPLRNIKKHLPAVLAAMEAKEIADKPMVLMALTTIRAETTNFEPISEFPSRFNTSPNGRLFDLYDHREDLGNQGPPDGKNYRGRGFIQLTGRFNYKKFGKEIGLGTKLLKTPSLANDSRIASLLLASFLKDKELPIKQALLENDLKHARRLVNGGSHVLGRFRQAYRIGKGLLADPSGRA